MVKRVLVTERQVFESEFSVAVPRGLAPAERYLHFNHAARAEPLLVQRLDNHGLAFVRVQLQVEYGLVLGKRLLGKQGLRYVEFAAGPVLVRAKSADMPKYGVDIVVR